MGLDLGRSIVLIVGLRWGIARVGRLSIVGLSGLRIVGLSGLRIVGLGGLKVDSLGRLGVGSLSMLRLKLRRHGGSTVVGVAGLRKVGANGRVEGVEGFFEVDRSRGPPEVLHVHRPDALTGLISPDGSRGESENVTRDCERSKSA